MLGRSLLLFTKMLLSFLVLEDLQLWNFKKGRVFFF
jgi:hypothetical protein